MNVQKERTGHKHIPEAPPLMSVGALARFLRPVRNHLIFCVILSALGAAAGIAPYVAIVQIAYAFK